MNSFLSYPDKEKRTYYNQVSALKGFPAVIIEKDFWVCWVLNQLFRIEGLNNHLLFKGGTSLSKVYNIIKRFSEDIDLTLDKAYLGFVGDNDPVNMVSNKKVNKKIEELGLACKDFVESKLIIMLDNIFKKSIESHNSWKLEIDSTDPDGQTIVFHYPSVFGKPLSYVRQSIKIEVGARGDIWPCSMHIISTYLKEMIPEGFIDDSVKIKVLNVERTFWEKATILHMFGNYPKSKGFPSRQSRHYYDFYCLLKSEAKAKAFENMDLLKSVAKHKSIYYRAAWAKYQDASNGNLKLIPDDIILQAVEHDYQKMQEMFFEEPPSFNSILEKLREAEEDLNRQSLFK
ncbi:MAG: nucleotidyl transferase AbiEii/AbiGii toxin family protein [Pseudomonadota bacterium]